MKNPTSQPSDPSKTPAVTDTTDTAGQTPPVPNRTPILGKHIIIPASIVALLILAIFNAVALSRNVKYNHENTELKASIEAAQAQMDYAENGHLIAQYLPELTPPIVRYQNESGQERLYYCTHTDISEPCLATSSNYWTVYHLHDNSNYESMKLSPYKEFGDQTLYYAYEYKNTLGETEQRLETFRIQQVGKFYHKIESYYECFPDDIDIDDPEAIANFLSHEPAPYAKIDQVNLPQISPDQVISVKYDDENTIHFENDSSCCGCTGCCCEDCKCTG